MRAEDGICISDRDYCAWQKESATASPDIGHRHSDCCGGEYTAMDQRSDRSRDSGQGNTAIVSGIVKEFCCLCQCLSITHWFTAQIKEETFFQNDLLAY